MTPATTNNPVVRVSHHTSPPPLTMGGTLELIGGRRMLRLADMLEYLHNERVYRLTEEWKPGNFDPELYS